MREIFSGLFAALLGLFSMGGTAPSSAPIPHVFTPIAQVRIIFGGDMMFDRTVRTTMKEKGDDFVFSCIEPVLAKADLVVANLEGPITSNPSKSIGSKPGGENNFTFTFPTSTATLLVRHNIKLVNLGNNHIMNFSREGLIETKKFLDAADVAYFGDPDAPETERVARFDMKGIPVSFVNWSDWTSDKTDHTVAQVRAEKDAGRVVFVYTHWGEEYVPPPEHVKLLARQFIDAGAEIVIGSHPHVIQEREFYNGKYIYYSLGNFIFDQYWDEKVTSGLLIEVAFTARGVEWVQEIPVELGRDRRTCPMPTRKNALAATSTPL